jgi:hypothetical protein
MPFMIDKFHLKPFEIAAFLLNKIIFICLIKIDISGGL